MPPRPAAPMLRQLRLRTLATQAQAAPSSSSSTSASSSSTAAFGSLPPLSPPRPAPLPTSTSQALSLLRETSTPSTGRYLLARLHARTYLLHPRDVLTIPKLKPTPPIGSTMSLTRILEVGSREFAIRSPAATPKGAGKKVPNGQALELATIPAELVKCELTVLEHTKSPLTRIMLKKRRKGYQRSIENKQEWTRFRVGDIILGE